MAKSDADRVEDAVARVESLARSGCPEPARSDIEQALLLLRTRLAPVLEPLRPPPVRRPHKEWSDALRKQAQRDLDAAILLGSSGQTGASTMLLQMTFEKIAKAAIAKKMPDAFRAHRRSHAVAIKFLPSLTRGIDKKWNSALKLAKSITNAHPAITKNGPHLEYPWEGTENVLLPDEHLAIIKTLFEQSGAQTTEVVKVINFARHLLNEFDTIFA